MHAWRSGSQVVCLRATSRRREGRRGRGSSFTFTARRRAATSSWRRAFGRMATPARAARACARRRARGGRPLATYRHRNSWRSSPRWRRMRRSTARLLLLAGAAPLLLRRRRGGRGAALHGGTHPRVVVRATRRSAAVARPAAGRGSSCTTSAGAVAAQLRARGARRRRRRRPPAPRRLGRAPLLPARGGRRGRCGGGARAHLRARRGALHVPKPRGGARGGGAPTRCAPSASSSSTRPSCAAPPSAAPPRRCAIGPAAKPKRGDHHFRFYPTASRSSLRPPAGGVPDAPAPPAVVASVHEWKLEGAQMAHGWTNNRQLKGSLHVPHQRAQVEADGVVVLLRSARSPPSAVGRARVRLPTTASRRRRRHRPARACLADPRRDGHERSTAAA